MQKLKRYMKLIFQGVFCGLIKKGTPDETCLAMLAHCYNLISDGLTQEAHLMTLWVTSRPVRKESLLYCMQ